VAAPTGVLCNVDFIHFVWNHFEFTSQKRHALTLIPFGFTEGNPILLALKYYRAKCDDWKDGTNCTACVEEYRQSVRDDVGCLLNRTYCCNVCLRQPPKLFDLAHNVYSKMVYNLDRFAITSDTTYEKFVYAARSTLVRYTRLLPPAYPNIILHCSFNTLNHRVHPHCPGRGSWSGCLHRVWGTRSRHCTMKKTYIGAVTVEKTSSFHSLAPILTTNYTKVPLIISDFTTHTFSKQF
jgi:hypothetical protein